MEDNYITYEAYSDCFFRDKKYTLQLDHENIKRIEVEATTDDKSQYKRGKLTLKFILFDSIKDRSLAKKICQRKVVEFLNSLTYITGRSFYKYEEVDSSYALHVNINYSEIGGIMEVFSNFSDENFEKVGRKIKNGKAKSYLYKLYRAAMNNNDSFTKFMLLYGLFYHMFRTQNEVDRFIWGIDDTEVEMDSTRGNGTKETIYTYLRNQVGHTQVDSNFDEVVVKMSNCVQKLSYYVKKAIKSRLV
ncbi:hypothetical protein J4772_31890 [Cohnella sp. LGH]|uniref:hypothetical protein n=1 Tax=Cohnella sp. LGH TaxID=1619153 RepID=UPI001ADBFC0E|nr:hypothetical protein [Cohnella sp. LGH]QTH42057.1 hypothetical protein J4772_31890 [Cohnella sp. LGH]